MKMKTRIDGHSIQQFVGQEVIILGTVHKVAPSGQSIEFRTTDGTLLNVRLPEVLDSDFMGYIEIHGTVQSKTTITAKNFVCFPEDVTKDFNVESYNETVRILNILGKNKWRL